MTRTYFVTRDSDCFGFLSDTVDLWVDRPKRTQLTIDAGWIWLPHWMPGQPAEALGEVRNLSATYVMARWGVCPKDDEDCIRIVVTDELCE
jgi:hypothetical protein